MSKYRMEDGTVVDTERATRIWEEQTDWDGHNCISRATGSQWVHERLYRSRRGRYYIVHSSQWQGSMPHAEWVSAQRAAQWLLMMEEDLPEDLREVEDQVIE